MNGSTTPGPTAALDERMQALEAAVTASAWADLATSPAEQVTGSKLRWALLIAVNWVGPLAWFRWGRRDRRAAIR
ncbi:PLD nuclease N-terminal domain-containing protein [Modestobacter sp. VKM Ac-2984]|uniref:PLD nuclease N-terminal domain-containing protein n=1 Tax=Modestobacter sp. VKM Ac-2984 TaxID=3004138 RepID=UPI0022AA3DDE|nr:PLD nuclease N-terminal domain-containing protein [Modestobacter sp. VKM Ac-2984]MCZ2816159.1 PLD nuclease N-terminal domain-containing protein [Modestobacter sp. VKM Ac-2984]